jgi:hypothetical protein
MEFVDQEVKLHTQYYSTTILVDGIGMVEVRDVYDGAKRILSQYLTEDGSLIDDTILMERLDSFLEYKGLRIKF